MNLYYDDYPGDGPIAKPDRTLRVACRGRWTVIGFPSAPVLVVMCQREDGHKGPHRVTYEWPNTPPTKEH